MSPKVHISATFVPTKYGSNLVLRIENPIDFTKEIGKFSPFGFLRLKEALKDVVDDNSYNMFFHRDPNHNYKFEEGTFQWGDIYVRKEPRKEGESTDTKVTAS